MFKNISRWIKFKNKIYSNLPKYHPEMGTSLKWDIRLNYKKVFDTESGESKQIGLATLSISQIAPNGLSNNNIYGFDWRKKKILTIRGAKWR